MAKAFTVKTLENLKPGPARREIADGLLPGLYFLLQPSGEGKLGVPISPSRTIAKAHHWAISGYHLAACARSRQNGTREGGGG
jgi:hypothetical protein